MERKMDTMTAFMLGAAFRESEQKVFDWNKAAELIKEHNATAARAGLTSKNTMNYLLQ